MLTPIIASHERQYVLWSDHLMQWLIILGLLALALVIGYANYQNAKPFRVESSSSLYPEEVLDSLQAILARDGWALGYRDAGSLIMSIDRNASFSSTAALGCASVWLALLHILASRSRITVQFDVSESSDGSIIITNGSKSGNGILRYITNHLGGLPKN